MQIEVTAPMPWLDCIENEETGIYTCIVEDDNNGEIVQVAWKAMNYTFYLAPLLAIVFFIVLIFSIIKSVKNKAHRGKWVLISVILFLLILLMVGLVTIDHYLDILGPWLY